MIKDIKNSFCSFEVYNFYSACMYKPSFEKFKIKAVSFLTSDFASTDCDAVGFYEKYGFTVKENTVSGSNGAYTRYDCSYFC